VAQVPHPPAGIAGELAQLYDVFVDWEGRLARELPGIERRLAEVGARRVLDAGCGTGQHLRALRERGYDAHGADVSSDMLEQAALLLGGAHGLHAWRLGEPPPAGLAGAAPFDAVLSLGNVWPQILSEADARATAQAIRALLRPGGLLLLGLKAFGVRLSGGDPYLPLLRRVRAGRPLWFVRFLDFSRAPLPDGTRVAGFHMAVVAGDAPGTGGEGEAEALLHRASLSRVWDPGELGAWWRAHGFEDVRVSASLSDPDAALRGEDVFVHARCPLAPGPPA
jgi:SAM-dependent methyltransferase